MRGWTVVSTWCRMRSEASNKYVKNWLRSKIVPWLEQWDLQGISHKRTQPNTINILLFKPISQTSSRHTLHFTHNSWQLRNIPNAPALASSFVSISIQSGKSLSNHSLNLKGVQPAEAAPITCNHGDGNRSKCGDKNGYGDVVRTCDGSSRIADGY